MKEQKKTLTIRLPESRIETIREMASVFGCSPSHLASVMLEAGFFIVDGLKDGKRLEDFLTNGDVQ